MSLTVAQVHPIGQGLLPVFDEAERVLLVLPVPIGHA